MREKAPWKRGVFIWKPFTTVCSSEYYINQRNYFMAKKDPVNLRLEGLHSFVDDISKESGKGLTKQETIRRMLKWLKIQRTKGRFSGKMLVSEVE